MKKLSWLYIGIFGAVTILMFTNAYTYGFKGLVDGKTWLIAPSKRHNWFVQEVTGIDAVAVSVINLFVFSAIGLYLTYLTLQFTIPQSKANQIMRKIEWRKNIFTKSNIFVLGLFILLIILSFLK